MTNIPSPSSAPGGHVIDEENYLEAREAIRDILMMYVEMTNYCGFGHGVSDEIRFDPLKFVDAEVHCTGFLVDMDLLRTGSALGFLAGFYDQWAEHDTVLATKAQRTALDAGRLNRFPDIEAVAREAVKRRNFAINDPWFDDAVHPLYRKYVLPFLKDLAASDRATPVLPEAP